MKLLYCFVILSTTFFSSRALNFNDSLYDILPSKYECGQQQSDNYDHSGAGTQTDEFPWLVHVPLESRVYNPQANLRCAGTLISKRYVLINKPCLQFVLTKVHLGQHDSSKDVTCNDCDDVLKIDVKERIIDESLDVVLLRLKEEVEFSDYVKPICLPFDDYPRAEVGATVYTSGWGKENPQVGNAPNLKKKVKQTIIDGNECKKDSKALDVKDEDLICVKVQSGSPNIPCYGDEGSPIMYFSGENWILEGVLSGVFSSGDGPCTTKGPAVGTRITEEILQWIVNKIHE